MSRIPGLRRLFRLDRPQDVARSVEDELQFHFEMAVEELMAGGLDAPSARAEAERRFGDVQGTREGLQALDRQRTVSERRMEWWGGLTQDLRHAVRGLRLRPGFTAAVVLTLGLGIGANATMFGIVDRLLLRPPAYLDRPQDVNLVYFASTYDGVERYQLSTSLMRFHDMRRWTRSFDELAAVYSTPSAVGSGEAAEELTVVSASADFWQLFSAPPVLGRYFGPEEDSLSENSRVAVVGYRYWQTHLGGRRDVLGQELRIGRHGYTVIGVTPAGFVGIGLEQAAVFIPITATANGEIFGDGSLATTSYGYNWLSILARRRAGVSVDAATQDLTSAFLRSYNAMREAQPRSRPVEVARPHALAGPVQRERGPNQSGTSKVALWLLGVAGVVLIIACANVGNLMLARTLGRRREIAVRLALGVSRGRLLRQLLSESLVLALCGGAAGILIAQFGGSVLRSSLLRELEWSSALTDGRILLLTMMLVVVATLATGLIPAWHAGRSDVAGSLKAGVREGTYQRSAMRTGMLVLQVGLSVVLLVGAGLFVRSLRHAVAAPLGFEPERVLYVEVQMREVSLDSSAARQLRERLLEAAAALPEVEHATRQATVPFNTDWSEDLFVAGIDSVNKLGDFELQGGTPDYFATMGTTVLRGRGIEASDREGSQGVMVVSQAMAAKLWPGRDPIGECVRVTEASNPCTIVVGVSEDIKTRSLSESALTYYRPMSQLAPGDGGLFVRTRGPATAQVEVVRRALAPLMPGQAYVSVMPLDDVVGQQRRAFQLGATMFTVFGGLALLLASIGLYGVVSYGVAQRRHELGVRVAIGAQVRDIVGMVLGEGMRVAVGAIAMGLVVSWVAGRWVAPLLFETSPHDSAIFTGVAVALLVVALVASLIPARRAAQADPSMALRSD